MPSQTQVVLVERDTLRRTRDVFAQCFPGRRAQVIADTNTFAVAGGSVVENLGRLAVGPLILGDEVAAEMSFVDRVHAAVAAHDAIPVAVGSGTINDLVKLAAHRAKRGYMVVGTAASMDGYTAFGASITQEGSKQTFDCPAPRALLADLAVLAAAPPAMAANGYADLGAKITAGADWILADALAVEPIDRAAWAILQPPLRRWLADPAAVKRREPAALANLMNGLVAGGLAMQVTKTSRPASGAEHQFSHLWDMQGHTQAGRPVAHGAKVAIGTLAVTGVYERLLAAPIERLDVDAAVARWPTTDEARRQVASLHETPALRAKAVEESAAKYLTRGQLRDRLSRLRRIWPELRDRLRGQLIPLPALRAQLTAAGAPTESAEIGITAHRLAASHAAARSIRRRYTVLDLAHEVNLSSLMM